MSADLWTRLHRQHKLELNTHIESGPPQDEPALYSKFMANQETLVFVKPRKKFQPQIQIKSKQQISIPKLISKPQQTPKAQRHEPQVQSKSKKRARSKGKKHQPQTVKYRGKECSKSDIEDCLKRLNRCKPRYPNNCCYARPPCRDCVLDVYDRKMA